MPRAMFWGWYAGLSKPENGELERWAAFGGRPTPHPGHTDVSGGFGVC